MNYKVNQNNLLLATLPQTKQQPVIEAYMQALLTPMGFVNQNLNEFIYGVTYSYYSPTHSYLLGDRVIGDWYYDINVYQCIGTTWSASPGALLASTINNSGYGYFPGDYFSVNTTTRPQAIGQVLTTHAPSGLFITINAVSSGVITVTTLFSGGSGYSVADRFYIGGGFSLAQGIIVTVGVGGNVLTYSILSGGTGYTTGVAYGTIIFPTYTGNVLTYKTLYDGWGYVNGTTASTIALTGSGVNLVLNVTNAGGFAPPSYTNVWESVNDNFIGVDERSLYFNQKLTLEWSLNRYFNTHFNQPNGVTMSSTHSDIYISDNTFAYSCFHIGPRGVTNSFSFIGPHGSSDWLTSGGYHTLALSPGIYTLYNINVPIQILELLPQKATSIANVVNKYNYAGIGYQILTY